MGWASEFYLGAHEIKVTASDGIIEVSDTFTLTITKQAIKLEDSVSPNLTGTNTHDTIWGDARDNVIHGNNGNDYIKGTGGNNILYGDAGDDIIVSNEGYNDIYGGEGNDTFVFEEISHSGMEGLDIIYDFEQGKDKIDLSQLADDGIKSFEDIGYTDNSHSTFVGSNHNGFHFFLTGVYDLTQDDFIFGS